MTTTYTSSHLRERDQIIQEKHQGEIRSLEAKIQKLKYALDESSRNGFDATHRGARLAQSLGFNDVYDAQAVIESSDHPITFKEAHDRLQAVETQLAIQKKDTEILQIKLARAEERAKTAEHESRRIAKEKSELEQRYDDMAIKKARATSKYQDDYKQWRGLFKEKHAEDQRRRQYEDDPDVDPEERKRRAALIHEHRRILMRSKNRSSSTKESASGSPRTFVTRNEDKENERTPTPLSQKRRFDSENIPPPSPRKDIVTPPIPLRNTLLKSVTNMGPPSSSPTVFLSNNPATTRVPFTLALNPIPEPIKIKEEPSCTPSPLNTESRHERSSSPIPMPHGTNSSDTEEDSQAIPFVTTDKITGERIVFKIPAPPLSVRLNRQNAIINTPPPRTPLGTTSSAQTPQTNFSLPHSDVKKLPEASEQPEEEPERPTKFRRLSESSHELSRPSSSMKIERSISNSAPRLTTATAKGKEREIQTPTTASSTPLTARGFGQKALSDYSAFKGRGRYGKGAGVSDQMTINAEYAINPATNAGLDFQYDEVVRNKDERRKMNAGDCECCREYYEGVGPLPSRLRQPLWASPPTTPTKPCPRHSHLGLSSAGDGNRAEGEGEPGPQHQPESARRQSEIESHKKTISRHRHTWARATTPPAYWDIGFPSTQEVGDINEKAKEMHKRKKERVALEASADGGRYRRK